MRCTSSAARWFLLALAAVGGPTESARAETRDERLEAAIDKLVKKNHFQDDEPGIAILIQQPGTLKFEKGYGLANLKTKTPITPLTTFELASVSKTFTATATLLLHDRGALSIDDDIRKHLPELPVYRKGSTIRVRDLLHHVSGLPDYMEFEDVPQKHRDYWTNDDYLPCFARDREHFPLDFPTGQKYDYNNTNFMLLASIVHRVSRKPFNRFLHDELFEPAGMKHSFVYESPQSVPAKPAAGAERAVGYHWRPKKKVWDATWGAPPARHETLLTVGDGGVWTNLEDMARWDLALRAGKFLKPETWKLTLSPSKTRDGKTNDYGLGWSIYLDGPNGLNGYGHEGSWGGFETSYYRYLKADRTTVILSNRGDFDPDAFWYALNEVVEKRLSND